MLELHLIEAKNAPAKAVNNGSGEYESGSWKVSIPTSERLVAEGGSLYLHSAHEAPSHWGGTVVGYRVQEDGLSKGRIVFRFKPQLDHKNVTTSAEGWGRERKYVGFHD